MSTKTKKKENKHWSEVIRDESVKACKKHRKIYLPINEFDKIVQLAPGMSWPKGTTAEDIYEKLEDLGVITVIYSSCLHEKIVIPTEKR